MSNEIAPTPTPDTTIDKAYFEEAQDKYKLIFSGLEESVIHSFLDLNGEDSETRHKSLGYYSFISTRLEKHWKDYATYGARVADLIRDLPSNVATDLTRAEGTALSFKDPAQFNRLKHFLTINHSAGMGTSIGFNKYFDSGIHAWQPQIVNGKFDSMLLIIGHDWYPIARVGKNNSIEYFEVPLKEYGLFKVHEKESGLDRYQQAVRHIDETQTLIGFINAIPGYRFEFAKSSGPILGAPYPEKAKLLIQIIDHLKSKFNIFKVVIWGEEVLPHLQAILRDPFPSTVFKQYHPGAYRNTMMQSAIDYAYFTSEFRKDK
jgi:hypothetical protein